MNVLQLHQFRLLCSADGKSVRRVCAFPLWGGCGGVHGSGISLLFLLTTFRVLVLLNGSTVDFFVTLPSVTAVMLWLS